MGMKDKEKKLIVFDLDGVLVESRDLHYKALNRALEKIDPAFKIGYEEHLTTYDALPTTKKLEMLSVNKGLPKDRHNEVWSLKQQMTQKVIIEEYEEDERIKKILEKLKEEGYILYCASNAVFNTIKLILLKRGFMEYFDYFISCEDVINPKPNPEIYNRLIARAGVRPSDCLIIEDSHIGRESALSSGAHLCEVSSPADVTYELIKKHLEEIEKEDKRKIKWKNKINIVIPMAGMGSRFSEAGYTFPKPLIEVRQKPMIQVVFENLNIEGKFIFICQKEHYEKYHLNYLLKLISKNCEIIVIDGLTEGAACTILKAKNYIDNDTPLLIANSDQFIEWNSNEFLYAMSNKNLGGGILTFNSSHPKWSYAKLNDEGFVCEVAEKKPISNIATVGVYYWQKGSDFVKYAGQMIEKNIRTNNEFYVCPVFNEAIQDNKKIKVWNCDKMWGIGTPEDLNYFLENYKGEV